MSITLGAFYKFEGASVPANGLIDATGTQDLTFYSADGVFTVSGRFGDALTPIVSKATIGQDLLATVFGTTGRGMIQIDAFVPTGATDNQMFFAELPDNDNQGVFVYWNTDTSNYVFGIKSASGDEVSFSVNDPFGPYFDTFQSYLLVWDYSGLAAGTDQLRLYRRPTIGSAVQVGAAAGTLTDVPWLTGGGLDTAFGIGFYGDPDNGSNTMDGRLDQLKLWVADAQITQVEIDTILANTDVEDYGLGGGTAPTIVTTTLPDGTVGVAYDQTIDATGSAAGTVWTVDIGTIPAGLTLANGASPPDGRLNFGSPTIATTYNFTLKCTNDFGFDTQAFTVIINPAEAAPIYNAGNIVLSEVKRVGIGYYSSPPPSLALAPSIGYTFGPVTFDTEISHAYASPDQATGPVQAHKTTESILVTVPFAEQHLANIARQLAYPIPGGSTFSFGNEDGRPTQYLAVYIVGTAPDGAERQITIHRCVAEGARQWSHEKAAMVVISAQFRATLDITHPEGEQFFGIEDV